MLRYRERSSHCCVFEGFVVLWGCRIGRLDLPHTGCECVRRLERKIPHIRQPPCQPATNPPMAIFTPPDADGSKGEDLRTRPSSLARHETRHEARPTHRPPRTTRRILTRCHSWCCGCFAALLTVISILDLQAKERRCIWLAWLPRLSRKTLDR